MSKGECGYCTSDMPWYCSDDMPVYQANCAGCQRRMLAVLPKPAPKKDMGPNLVHFSTTQPREVVEVIHWLASRIAALEALAAEGRG